MRKSVTQEFDYGCGIACYAFVLGISYKDAEQKLGKDQARSDRFWVKDLAKAINKAGFPCEKKYVKSHIKTLIYTEGAVVLIGRSKNYPVGHYLVRHAGKWMDPWINLPVNRDIADARSGFRRKLPGAPKYVILPVTKHPYGQK